MKRNENYIMSLVGDFRCRSPEMRDYSKEQGKDSETAGAFRCPLPSLGSSLHCRNHQPLALRSYKKYKRQGAVVESLRWLLSEEANERRHGENSKDSHRDEGISNISELLVSPLDDRMVTLRSLLRLYQALESECSLRTKHQERFFIPIFYDTGHTAIISERRDLIRKCEERLQELFKDLEGFKEENGRACDESEEEGDKEERRYGERGYIQRARAKFAKREKKIREREKRWKELDRIMEGERRRREEGEAKKKPLMTLIIRHLETVIREQGWEPVTPVFFYSYEYLREEVPMESHEEVSPESRIEDSVSPVIPLYDRRTETGVRKGVRYRCGFVGRSSVVLGVVLWVYAEMGATVAGDGCFRHPYGFSEVEEIASRGTFEALGELYRFILYNGSLLSGILNFISVMGKGPHYPLIVDGGTWMGLACIPPGEIDRVTQGYDRVMREARKHLLGANREEYRNTMRRAWMLYEEYVVGRGIVRKWD